MSYHKISVFFEMTERNGTVVCYDGACPRCLKAVSLMTPLNGVAGEISTLHVCLIKGIDVP